MLTTLLLTCSMFQYADSVIRVNTNTIPVILEINRINSKPFNIA